GRRARSCTRRCRSTIRRSASPTSRVPSSCSAGSPRLSSRKASSACSRASDGSRSLRKQLGVFAAIVLLAAGLSVPAAQAKNHMLIGMQDDAMVLSGNPDFTFRTLKQLRTQIVRVNLNWNQVAKRRPAHPQDPADPAYDWGVYDRAARYAGQNGMQLMMTILFTPAWANGGKPRNVPPNNYTDLRNFSYAAATRYSGHYIPNTDDFNETYLPAVKYWLAWEESKHPNWLQQN